MKIFFISNKLMKYEKLTFGRFLCSPTVGKYLTRVLLLGMLLGFLAYATYNFTNQATLKDWPILVTIVDSIWGAVVSGLTATLVYVLTR